MAKRKKSRRSRKKPSLIMTAGSIASGAMIYGAYQKKGLDGAIAQATGFRQGTAGDGFDTGLLLQTYTPMGIAIAGKMILSGIGAGRYLRQVPIIGKKFSL